MGQQSLDTLRSLLLKAKSVGIDTPCFIYHFSEHPKYFPLTNALFDAVEKGKVAASTSMITIAELFVLPEKVRQPFLRAKYENALKHFPNLEVMPVGWPQSRLAAKLRAIYQGLHTPDAIQLATALFAGCHLFITNDKRLQQAKEIEVIVLDEFV